jgi:hemerythrin-like domain-containing protein
MADLNKEELDSVDRMSKPAEKECEILGKKEALKDEVVEEKKEEEPSLPKLSAAEFRTYNSMAEHMEYFVSSFSSQSDHSLHQMKRGKANGCEKQHNHFRQTWQMLYNACLNNKRPANLSLKQFISTGLQFCSHLSTHHAIEEQHIFPLLAQKMPEFKAGRNAAELLRQHKEIHKGMDAFEEYLEGCRSGEHELNLIQMKVKMDSWGTVLWSHLEQEVKTLGAENMRKYWTIEEMRRMPM